MERPWWVGKIHWIDDPTPERSALARRRLAAIAEQEEVERRQELRARVLEIARRDAEDVKASMQQAVPEIYTAIKTHRFR